MKYAVIKRYKGAVIDTLDVYNEKEKADDICNYMNEQIKKISALIKFEVKEIVD